MVAGGADLQHGRVQRRQQAELHEHAELVPHAPVLGALLPHGDGGDPVLAGFTATIDQERRTGGTRLVQHPAGRFGLAP